MVSQIRRTVLDRIGRTGNIRHVVLLVLLGVRVEWGQEACERMEPVVLPSDDDGQHHHGLRCSVLLQEIWKLKSFLASSQIAKY